MKVAEVQSQQSRVASQAALPRVVLNGRSRVAIRRSRSEEVVEVTLAEI